MSNYPIVTELEIDGTWTDVTDRARRFPPTIRRGRADAASQVQPTTASVVLDNTDGELTPRNPESAWYPHIRRGLPCRISVDGGPHHLALTGASGGRATTPDNAALDITGDIFFAVELPAPVMFAQELSGQRYEIGGKWADTGNQRSYHLGIDEFGRLVFLWTTAGTLVSIEGATSTHAIPMRTAGPVSVSVSLTANFLGAHLVAFHAINGSLSDLLAGLATDETAYRVGDLVAGAGTTSIFSGSAALQFGDLSDSSGVGAAYPGAIRRAQVRSGTFAGTIVANPDFTAQALGATGFTDSAGRVWSVSGDAAIANRQVRFIGSVDSIALGWPLTTKRDDPVNPGVARVELTLAGTLRRLRQGSKPLGSTLQRIVTSAPVADNVAAYWPLEDERSATTNASPLEGVRAGSIIGASLASDDSLDASLPLPSVSGGDLFRWRFDVPPTIAANTNWQSAMVAKIPTAPVSPAELQLMVVDASSTEVRTWAIQINDTIVRLRGLDQTGTQVINDTLPADPLMFGGWMLWTLEIEQNGGNIDWSYTAIRLPDGFGFGDNGSIAGSCGRPTRLRGGSTAPAGDGFSFGHFIVTTGLSTGWLAGADTAWINETAAHRVWRLCREEGIPLAVVGDGSMVDNFRGDGTYSQLMGPQLPKTLVDLLEECAVTDHGILYEQRGVTGLAYRTGRSLYNQTAALDLDASDRDLVTPFEPVLDDQRLRNDVTVSREGGSSARVVDDTSIADEGRYDEDVTVNTASDLLLPDQAGWRLHIGTWPELRLPSVATSMHQAGTDVLAQWIDTDLGDRLAVSNLMRQYEETADHLLEGYEETLTFFHWLAQLTGSPAGPWEIGIRDDDVRGIRDTAGTVLIDDMTALDTTALIAVNTGPEWTQDAADYPFDLNIGGERVTATELQLLFGDLVFTVVRSVNGVVKAHVTGEDVRLWRPSIRAL